MSLVVNFFGGPSAGKTGLSSCVHGYMRKHGYPCEVVHEAAKDYVWRGDKHTLDNQVLITAIQFDRVLAVYGKMPVIINESPIPTGLVFPTPRGCSPAWRRAVIDQFLEFRNLNFFLHRDPPAPHEHEGRREDGPQAAAKDLELLAMLDEFGIPYTPLQMRRGSDLELAVIPTILKEAGLEVVPGH